MKVVLSMFLVPFLAVSFILASMDGVWGGERAMKFGPGEIIIPEDAPDFLLWETTILGGKKFPNGNVLILAESINPSNTVFVLLLAVKIDTKIGIIAAQVVYLHPGWEKDRSKIKTSFLVDSKFMKSGVISDKLEWTDQAPSLELIEGILEKTVFSG